MLNKYLLDIEAGKSINFRAFLKNLPLPLQNKQLYSLSKDGKGTKYFVAIKSSQTLEELKSIGLKKANPDRLAATELGNSHKEKVGRNGFAARTPSGSEYSLLVVDSQASIFEPSFAQANECVIVENRELFYSEKLLGLLVAHQINTNNCVIILGNGSEVKNQYLTNYLINKFQKIHCLFDHDLGGLLMYKSIVNATKGTSVEPSFAMPNDMRLCTRPSYASKPSSSDFHAAIRLTVELELPALRADLLKTHRFMEQEMLLVNLNRDTESE